MHSEDAQYVEPRKNSTDELMSKAKTETQTQRTNLWIPRVRGKEWNELGVCD